MGGRRLKKGPSIRTPGLRKRPEKTAAERHSRDQLGKHTRMSISKDVNRPKQGELYKLSFPRDMKASPHVLIHNRTKMSMFVQPVIEELHRAFLFLRKNGLMSIRNGDMVSYVWGYIDLDESHDIVFHMFPKAASTEDQNQDW